MKGYLFIFFTSISTLLFSQSTAEDSVRYNSAIDWLNNKLNYEYYDGESGKWWKNTFYINEKGIVTLKHISSSKRNTANIKDKSYVIRTFRLEDLNPATFKVSTVDKSQGRITKGQMLELRTFGSKKVIGKSINNKKGSSTSYLNLSFPTGLSDSSLNTATLVKEQLTYAIEAKTKIYASKDESDVEKIFLALTGQFENQKGTKWFAKSEMPHVLKVEYQNDDIKYLGYQTNSNGLYFLEISNDGMNKIDLEIKTDSTLILSDKNKPFIELLTKNSFRINGEELFRK